MFRKRKRKITNPAPRRTCSTVLTDFDALAEVKTALGTAAIIVMNKETDIILAIARLMHFYQHESCGQVQLQVSFHSTPILPFTPSPHHNITTPLKCPITYSSHSARHAERAQDGWPEYSTEWVSSSSPPVTSSPPLSPLGPCVTSTDPPPVEGNAKLEEIDMLQEISLQVEGHTICALGDGAAWPAQVR